MRNIKHLAILIALFSCNLFFSQIKIEWKQDLKTNTTDIFITNESDSNYVLPLDIEHLRPYDFDCSNFQEFENTFPALSLMLIIENQNKELLKYYTEDYVDIETFDKVMQENIKKNKLHEEVINKWKKKNNIEDSKYAEINYKIMHSLLFLRSKETKKFRLKFNIHDITGQKNKIYSYDYKENEKYKMYLEYCDPSKAYKYLTDNQIKELKNFIMFNKSIKSNVIENR